MKSGTLSLHMLLIVLCCCIDRLWSRDPFEFADQTKKKKIDACRPQLQSISHGKAMSLVLIKCDKKSFIVGKGQTVDQWRVHEIASNYIVLVDKDSDDKKLILEA